MNAHPSRSQPVCARCAHHVSHFASTPSGFCNHPSQPINRENGKPLVRSADARLKGQPCGPEGLLFAPRARGGDDAS